MDMSAIIERLANAFKRAFKTSRTTRVSPLAPTAQALSALALQRAFAQPVTVIASHGEALESLHRDLLAFLASDGLQEEEDLALLYFPAWETAPSPRFDEDYTITGQRLRTLRALLARNQPHRGLLSAPHSRLPDGVAAGEQLDAPELPEPVIQQSLDFIFALSGRLEARHHHDQPPAFPLG